MCVPKFLFIRFPIYLSEEIKGQIRPMHLRGIEIVSCGGGDACVQGQIYGGAAYNGHRALVGVDVDNRGDRIVADLANNVSATEEHQANLKTCRSNNFECLHTTKDEGTTIGREEHSVLLNSIPRPSVIFDPAVDLKPERADGRVRDWGRESVLDWSKPQRTEKRGLDESRVDRSGRTDST